LKSEFEGVDFERDWKLITIYIGGNDLCSKIEDWDQFPPENFIANYNKTLTYLRQNVPRALVSVVTVLDLHYIMEIQNYGFICNLVHKKECPIATDAHKDLWPQVIERMRKYQQQLKHLLATEYQDCGDNFAVVLQTFNENVQYPETINGDEIDGDLSFLAPDCFHFSQKGHAAMARVLWNSLITPVSVKPNSTVATEILEGEIKCLDKNCPFLATNQNSQNCERFKNLRNID